MPRLMRRSGVEKKTIDFATVGQLTEALLEIETWVTEGLQHGKDHYTMSVR